MGYLHGKIHSVLAGSVKLLCRVALAGPHLCSWENNGGPPPGEELASIPAVIMGEEDGVADAGKGVKGVLPWGPTRI